MKGFKKALMEKVGDVTGNVGDSHLKREDERKRIEAEFKERQRLQYEAGVATGVADETWKTDESYSLPSSIPGSSPEKRRGRSVEARRRGTRAIY